MHSYTPIQAMTCVTRDLLPFGLASWSLAIAGILKAKVAMEIKPGSKARAGVLSTLWSKYSKKHTESSKVSLISTASGPIGSRLGALIA